MDQNIKNYRPLKFLHENLEKIRPNELYHAPLEGSTTFLLRSSTTRTPLDSCRLAELKYAFFSWTGRNTKKLRRSNLCLLTIFKNELLEGSTFVFQDNYTSRCEQVWTDVDRCEKFRTGLNKSEKVWSTVFPRPWAARCTNFALPFDQATPGVHFQNPLNVCGIPRVLHFYFSTAP